MRRGVQAAWLLFVLVAVVFAPVHQRDGRAVLFVVGLLGLLACRWSNMFRIALLHAILASFLWRFTDAGWSAVFGVFLVGEAVEWLATQSESFHRFMLGIVAAFALAMALHATAQRLGLAPWRSDLVVGAYATLDNPNTLGAYLVMALPAVLLSFWAPLALVLVPGIIAAHSSIPVVALLGVAGVWALASTHRWRWPALATASVGALAYALVVDPTPASAIQRGGVWLWTLEHAREAWLLGWGPGSFNALGLAAPGEPRWSHAHNEFVQAYYELGVLGLVAALGYVGWLFHGLWSRRQGTLALTALTMLTAGVVSALGHFVFHIAITVSVLLVTLGAAEHVIYQEVRP